MSAVRSPALALLAVGTAVVAARFTWQAGIASIYDDSVSYLVMAQVFAPYGTASAPVLAAFADEPYPPVFPLLIALSGGAYDWHYAHLLVAVAFAATIWLTGALCVEVTGSRNLGIATALVVAVMPGSWLNVKGILSEYPYMALVLAALLLHRRLRQTPTMACAAGLGILLAAAALTRTIGVTLVVAIAAAEAHRFLRLRERARLRPIAASLALPVAAIALWYALRGAASEGSYAASASSFAGEVAREGPGRFFGMLSLNAGAIADAWLNALVIYWGEPWQPRYWLGMGLGAVGLGATFYRAERVEADAVYVIFFLAILLAWPFPGQMYRLAFPVIPLVLMNAFRAIAAGLKRALPASRIEWREQVAVLVALALAVPATFFIVERAGTGGENSGGHRRGDIAEFYRIPFRASAEANAAAQIGVLSDLERIRSTTPEGARVMWYKADYVALLAGRHGIAMDRPADAAQMTEQVRRLKPDYVYFSSVHPRDSAARLGNPLEPWQHVRAYADLAWSRGAAPGEMQSVLLKIDPARLAP